MRRLNADPASGAMVRAMLLKPLRRHQQCWFPAYADPDTLHLVVCLLAVPAIREKHRSLLRYYQHARATAEATQIADIGQVRNYKDSHVGGVHRVYCAPKAAFVVHEESLSYAFRQQVQT